MQPHYLATDTGNDDNSWLSSLSSFGVAATAVLILLALALLAGESWKGRRRSPSTEPTERTPSPPNKDEPAA